VPEVAAAVDVCEVLSRLVAVLVEMEARSTLAETAWPEMSLCESRGVSTRHAAFFGVVRAHAGSWTNRRRPDQPPPYADANDE
jgi:hypothetical protein